MLKRRFLYLTPPLPSCIVLLSLWMTLYYTAPLFIISLLIAVVIRLNRPL